MKPGKNGCIKKLRFGTIFTDRAGKIILLLLLLCIVIGLHAVHPLLHSHGFSPGHANHNPEARHSYPASSLSLAGVNIFNHETAHQHGHCPICDFLAHSGCFILTDFFSVPTSLLTYPPAFRRIATFFPTAVEPVCRPRSPPVSPRFT